MALVVEEIVALVAVVEPGTNSGVSGFRSAASTTNISLLSTSSCSAISSCVYVLAALSESPKETAIMSEVFLNPILARVKSTAYEHCYPGLDLERHDVAYLLIVD